MDNENGVFSDNNVTQAFHSTCHATIYETVYGNGQIHTKEHTAATFQIPKQVDDKVVWLHCVGRMNKETVKQLLGVYDIHSLVCENITSSKQRSKIESYPDYVFCVTKLLAHKKAHVFSESVSIVFGKNFLLSFQSTHLGEFLSIRDELLNCINNAKEVKPDFLAYMIIDRTVDLYFDVLDGIVQRLEKVDHTLFDFDGTDSMHRIHRLRRDIIFMHATLLPVQDSVSLVMANKIALFQENSRLYMRDVMDHVMNLVNMLNTTREQVDGMMNVYLSLQSNKLNEHMRILTSITIIFMPLTLIAGIYGMNFTNMPELDWRYGYFIVLGFMLMISFGMVYVFRKRKWL